MGITLENTRMFKAKALRKLVERGPASFMSGSCTADDYRLWVNSWVIPELDRLVPELRQLKKSGATK